MDNLKIIALAYSLASDMFNGWRENRRLSDGSFLPMIKKSKDEEWNLIHGTDEVDIANCPFEDLPSNWQFEYLESAKEVISLVFNKVMNRNKITNEQITEMAEILHEKWLERNDWVFDQNYGYPILAVPYKQLPDNEKEKYKNQFGPAIQKVKDYLDGLISIDEICDKYNIRFD